jgi:hypothetical protein
MTLLAYILLSKEGSKDGYICDVNQDITLCCKKFREAQRDRIACGEAY